MSAATSLLRRLQSLGVELRVNQGKIAYRPRERVTADIQAEIAQHKQQLLRLLSDDPALGKPVVPSLDGVLLSLLASGACPACRGTIYWRLKPDGEPVCAICHPPGPPPDQIRYQRGRCA